MTSYYYLFQECSQTVAMQRVTEYIKAEHSSQPFTQDELDAAIQKMTDANTIMVADDMLFLI